MAKAQNYMGGGDTAQKKIVLEGGDTAHTFLTSFFIENKQLNLMFKTRASHTTGTKGNNLFASNSRLWYHVKRIKYQ